MSIIEKEVWVDAGLVWIGDPCYVMSMDSSHGPKTWAEFCDKLENHDNVSEPLGEGIGLAISSGWGDGSYKVKTRIGADGRVKSVFIDFEQEFEDE